MVRTYTRCKCPSLHVYNVFFLVFSQRLCAHQAPIKIMLKMCSSSLQRKMSRLYRCKRKKENKGPRRKYERNNVPGALGVADVSAKLCSRVLKSSSTSFFHFSRSRISIFFLFSTWRRRSSLVSAHYHSLSPFTPSIAISHTACPLDFLLYISAFFLSHSLSCSLFLSVTFILVHTLSLSHRVQ